MLWVVLQAADELRDRMALEADLVDGVEQREPAEGRGVHEKPVVFWSVWEQQRVSELLNLLVNQVFVLEDEINLSCCRWSLQLLSVQHLSLQILDRLREHETR